MPDLLPPGIPAPEFTMSDQDGTPVSLKDFRGRMVVLYFYPKDETYGCTREACGFRDDIEALAREGATVLGVSVDNVDSHKRFQEHHGLNFKLLADPDGRVMRAYRAQGLLGYARRITYVIDDLGLIRLAYGRVRAKDHAQEVLQDIRTLHQGMRASPP